MNWKNGLGCCENCGKPLDENLMLCFHPRAEGGKVLILLACQKCGEKAKETGFDVEEVCTFRIGDVLQRIKALSSYPWFTGLVAVDVAKVFGKISTWWNGREDDYIPQDDGGGFDDVSD